MWLVGVHQVHMKAFSSVGTFPSYCPSDHEQESSVLHQDVAVWAHLSAPRTKLFYGGIAGKKAYQTLVGVL